MNQEENEQYLFKKFYINPELKRQIDDALATNIEFSIVNEVADEDDSE